MPFIGMYAITMIKDTLFTICFILWFIHYVEVIKEKEISNVLGVRIVILSVSCSLTRKTGVYIMLLCGILLLFNCKRRIWGLLSMLTPAVLIFILFEHIIFPTFLIHPCGKQQILGTLFQQTAAVLIEHEDDIPQEEFQAIAKVIDVSTIKDTYQFHLTDYVKSEFYQDASTEDIFAYLKIWLKEGIRYPKIYLQALMGTCGGYFAPVSNIDIYTKMGSYGFEGLEDMNVSGISGALRSLMYDGYLFLSSLPGVGLFFKIALYSFYIPVLAIVACLNRCSKKDLINRLSMLFPIVVLTGVTILGPGNIARYVLPEIVLAPIILGIGVTAAEVPPQMHPAITLYVRHL